MAFAKLNRLHSEITRNLMQEPIVGMKLAFNIATGSVRPDFGHGIHNKNLLSSDINVGRPHRREYCALTP